MSVSITDNATQRTSVEPLLPENIIHFTFVCLMLGYCQRSPEYKAISPELHMQLGRNSLVFRDYCSRHQCSKFIQVYCLRRWPNFESTMVQCLVLAGCDPVVVVGKAGPGKHKKWNESGFRPPLCTYGLNWAREAQEADSMLDQCWANVADKNVVIVLYTTKQYKNIFFIFTHLKSSSSGSSRELGQQFVTWTGWRWQWQIQAWKS